MAHAGPGRVKLDRAPPINAGGNSDAARCARVRATHGWLRAALSVRIAVVAYPAGDGPSRPRASSFRC